MWKWISNSESAQNVESKYVCLKLFLRLLFFVHFLTLGSLSGKSMKKSHLTKIRIQYCKMTSKLLKRYFKTENVTNQQPKRYFHEMYFFDYFSLRGPQGEICEKKKLIKITIRTIQNGFYTLKILFKGKKRHDWVIKYLF